jgi:aldehyde:ferredoxin oxidoreductase
MIGPGGEKMVRYACVINDLRHAAGRSGLGAVMGSKNLKAVAALGKGAVEVANDEGVKEMARWMRDHWKARAWGSYDMGTNGGLQGLSDMGALPTRNFQDGSFEGAPKINGPALRDTITINREACFACPIRCKRVVEVNDEEYQVNPIYGGPEYETVGAFGSNCGVDDLRAVAKAHELCNAYSLDTISTGMAVSFAMECYEAGLITKEDTGGLELNFGNGHAMVEMTRMICEREGLGDLLAEGTRRAAEKIGGGSMEFSIDVKGQPFPMHECRTRHGQALGYAVSPTGADHMHNFWDNGLAMDPPRRICRTWASTNRCPPPCSIPPRYAPTRRPAIGNGCTTTWATACSSPGAAISWCKWYAPSRLEHQRLGAGKGGRAWRDHGPYL